MSMANVLSDQSNPSALITVQELGRLLKMSVRSVWRLRSAGAIPPPVRIGGAVRWRLEDVARWIERGCPAVDQSILEAEGEA